MGEVAEMMLDGTLCQMCGVFMGDAVGYPVTCTSCGGDEAVEPHSNEQARVKSIKFKCSECKKSVSASGAMQHLEAAHGLKVQRAATAKEACSICGKRVKAVGVADHMRDAHGVIK
jgi:hypothetical protein